MSHVRILIAEDSDLFVTLLEELIATEPDMEIVRVVGNGEDAIAACQELRPDIVLMDIQMPKLDGLQATEQIMAQVPTPILIITADPFRGGVDLTFHALNIGALDLLAKSALAPNDHAARADFLRKVRLCAEVPVIRHVRGRRKRSGQEPAHGAGAEAAPSSAKASSSTKPKRRRQPRRRSVPTPYDTVPGPIPTIIGVAASTGGPKALARLLADLPADFPAALLIVQHITAGFSAHLARWLNENAPMRVVEGSHGVRILPGTAYIAPTGKHMALSGPGWLSVQGPPPDDTSRHCPSGDLLLESIARHAPSSIGVILSGMGSDGAQGLKSLHDAGGLTLVQDRESSVVYGMPNAALQLGAATDILALDEMAQALTERLALLERSRA